jgi:hypothetical protein
VNAPETADGWEVWSLAMKTKNQLRTTGFGVVGWDLGAAMTFGVALGIEPAAIAELLPVIEAAAIRKINEDTAAHD